MGLLVLGMLAYAALLDEFLDRPLQPRPGQELEDAKVSGGGARVPSHGTAMERTDELGVEGGVGANLESVATADPPVVQL